MWQILAIILALSLTTEVQAKLVTKTVEYRQDGTVCRGFLAYDDASRRRRPGVLVVHEWWGLNDFARQQAEKLAGLGYVAFAADMYGKGATTTNREEAARWAGELRGNPALMRERARAALKVLAADPLVNPRRLAAIGFCFGGTTVLELAYSGAELAGVVSFHGGLPIPTAQDLEHLKASVLVLHGAEDPHVTPKDVVAWQEVMDRGGADWQMMLFGGAVHAFTNPAAGNDKTRGSAYNPRAARRAWRYMQEFFRDIFRVKARD